MAHTDGTVHLDILNNLIQAGTVHMAVHRNTGAHFAAEQVVHRHIGHLAFDVPKGHINTGNRVVHNGTAAPVSVLMHELPQLGNVADLLANEKRTQVGLDEMLDRQVAVGKSGTAQAVQARFAGFHLDNHQIDSLRRGTDHADVAYGG